MMQLHQATQSRLFEQRMEIGIAAGHANDVKCTQFQVR